MKKVKFQKNKGKKATIVLLYPNYLVVFNG